MQRGVFADLFAAPLLAVAFDQGAQRLEQIGDALAMLGADRDRIAKAEAEGFEDPEFRSAALGLVGDHDHRRRFDPKPAADLLVERSQALAGIDHEQSGVSLAHRGLGLLAHPARKRVRVLVLEARGVDHPELEADQTWPHPRVGRA